MIICGGRIDISAGRISLLSVIRPKNFKKVHPSDRLPFPLEFRNHNAVRRPSSCLYFPPSRWYHVVQVSQHQLSFLFKMTL